MPYTLLADVVALTHLLLIVFALLGALLIRYRLWLIGVHLPLAAWVSVIMFTDWTCPLTPLEQSLRRLGGEESFQEGFVSHYILPLVDPTGFLATNPWALGVFALGCNLCCYSYLLWRIQQHGNTP